MVYTGVDACKRGWFAVMLREGSNWQVAVFSDIFNLWQQCKDSKLILIDVPIGLRQSASDKRDCDNQARKLIGTKRGSSVFPVPCRDAIYADRDEASKINEMIAGQKLSRQSLGIISMVRQVDQLLLSDETARLRIRETHPELCFWALNGGEPMKYSKKKRDGFLERMEVLLSVYPYTKELVYYAERKYPRKEVARDDILDALVAAATASKERQGLSFLPEKATFDSKGLPMQMAYYLIPTPVNSKV